MMRLPQFQYLAPATIREAVVALANGGHGVALAGGGTDLYPNMKRLQVSPPVVVGLRGISEIQQIRPEKEELRIGAGVSLTQLVQHPQVRRNYRPLVDATLTISTPLLRNMGTVGGNLCLDTRCHFLNQSFFWRKAVGSCLKAEGDICLVAPGGHRCWAITSGDLPPLLIALGATVELAGPQGSRSIPLADLYGHDGIDYLAKSPQELLTEVRVPALNGRRAGYLKLRQRSTFDFPALGVAAVLDLTSEGICHEATIVLGAVTYRPISVPEAELLVGEKLTHEVIESVAEAIQKKARPMHLADYTHSYRRQMVSVYVSRLLKQLVSEWDGQAAGRATSPGNPDPKRSPRDSKGGE